MKLHELAFELEMSLSAVHTCMARCKKSGLIVPSQWGDTISRRNVTEVMLHGVKYFIPEQRVGVTRRIPTAQLRALTSQ